MGQANEKKTLYIRASDVEPKEVTWLWYPYIPFGKVTIVQGNPGDGKSTLMLTIAAKLTNGEILPFTEPKDLPEPMTVIYQTTEDDADDTVVPRFMTAGGNRDRLIFIKEDESPLTFADARIGTVIRETGAKLLILDPLSSYIGKCSLNAANEVRPQFNHLIRAAKSTGCAIVVVDHMNKMQGQSVIFRTVGSIDVVGAVRSVITVVPDPDDKDKRYMVMSKSNLAPMGSAISFTLGEEGVTFLEELDTTADELLNRLSGFSPGRPDEKLQEAMDFISVMLAEGPVSAAECEARLADAGIRAGTAKKAKKQLGVVSSKPHLSWFWSMP